MYHKTTLVGRLGRDVVLRYTPDGKAVASFNVAVSGGYGDKKMTIWYRVSVWGKDAESCNNYLKKGSMVLVEGRLIADATTGGPKLFKKQDGTEGTSFEINANTVRFLSTQAGESMGDEQPAPVGDDEQIPF